MGKTGLVLAVAGTTGVCVAGNPSPGGRSAQKGHRPSSRACDGEEREPKELTTTYLCAVRPSQARSSISSARLLGGDQESQTTRVQA